MRRGLQSLPDALAQSNCQYQDSHTSVTLRETLAIIHRTRNLPLNSENSGKNTQYFELRLTTRSFASRHYNS